MNDYIYKICISILHEKGVENFPAHFINNSKKWLISKLSKHNPTTPALLEIKNEDVTEVILLDQLPNLEKEAEFMEEFGRIISEFIKFDHRLNIRRSGQNIFKDYGISTDTHAPEALQKIKNIITNSVIVAKGNIEIGDKNFHSTTHQGDVIHGNKVVNNNYYKELNDKGNSQPENKPILKDINHIKELIIKGDLEQAIKQLITISKKSNLNTNDQNIVISISNRYNDLVRKNANGILAFDNMILEQNKIRESILNLLNLL